MLSFLAISPIFAVSSVSEPTYQSHLQIEKIPDIEEIDSPVRRRAGSFEGRSLVLEVSEFHENANIQATLYDVNGFLDNSKRYGCAIIISFIFNEIGAKYFPNVSLQEQRNSSDFQKHF